MLSHANAFDSPEFRASVENRARGRHWRGDDIPLRCAKPTPACGCCVWDVHQDLQSELFGETK